MDPKVKEELERLLGDDAEQWTALADDINRTIQEDGLIARGQGPSPEPGELDPTEPPSEQVPVPEPAELEMDEETLAVIIRGVASSDAFQGELGKITETLGALTESVAALTKQVEGVGAASTEGLVAVKERLSKLEQDEEQKQREWLADLPQRQTLRVTYRPREANDPNGPAQPTNTLADVAESTLANMPRLQ